MKYEKLLKDATDECNEYYNMMNSFQIHCDMFLSKLPLENNPYIKISSDIHELFIKYKRAIVVPPPRGFK